jgi:hypothetical protein
VTRPSENLFPVFLRECIRPGLKARGYAPAGQTYRKTLGPATAHLIFMQYRSAHMGHFDLRMTITLDPFRAELGAVLMEDLSRHLHGSVAGSPWGWPCERSGWPALAESLIGPVAAGAALIESFLHLPTLARCLEGQMRFAGDVDSELSEITQAMTSAGVEVAYQSPGYTSKAGKVRPDKVAALSYCYELMEEWQKSLDSWRDYMTTPQSPDVVRKARVRQRYLEEKCAT